MSDLNSSVGYTQLVAMVKALQGEKLGRAEFQSYQNELVGYFQQEQARFTLHAAEEEDQETSDAFQELVEVFEQLSELTIELRWEDREASKGSWDDFLAEVDEAERSLQSVVEFLRS